jgi:exopolyphosphatase / guanosine-5'-triphosphate,3'-diphosphate pyrophosphatase
MKRIAAIDIGTNSVRSLIVEVFSNGRYRLLDDEKAHTRLGEGVASSGQLSDAAIDRTIEALGRMKGIAEQFGAERIRAVATSAVRRAENRSEFLDRARSELGLDVEVISAAQEGRLAFLSASAHFQLAGRAGVMDIGGGSVELVLVAGGQMRSGTSLQLGAVTLTERFAIQDPLPDSGFKAMRRHVREALSTEFGSRPEPLMELVGSGGTVTSIANMVGAQADHQFATVHKQDVTRADVVHLLAMLKRMTLDQRRHVAGLTPARADIVVAGVLVVDEVMRRFDVNVLRVNAEGLREGLLIDTIAAGRRRRAPTAMQGVAQLARRCRWEKGHCRQVAALAMSLFDQLAEPLRLDPAGRPLLEAAALLHDIGSYIAYGQHHKHSYHLISHADLPGFSPRQQEIIAAVARYHRGALPKRRHEALQRLDEGDRALVERLGALLRLADGLDRSRSQRVASVQARVEDGTAILTLAGEGDLGIEGYGARDKGDLFRRAFGIPIEILF